MVGRKKTQKPTKADVTKLPEVPYASFLTLKLSPQSLSRFPTVTVPQQVKSSAGTGDEDERIDVEDERTDAEVDGATPAKASSTNDGHAKGHSGPQCPSLLGSLGPSAPQAQPQPQAPRPASRRRRLHSPAHHRQRRAKSILKPSEAHHAISTSTSTITKHHSTAGFVSKSVTLDLDPTIQHIEPVVYSNSDEENAPPIASHTDTTDVTAFAPEPPQADDEMSGAPPVSQRPQLKLKLSSRPVNPQADGVQPLQTPNPTSAVRTPSIKLKLGKPLSAVDSASKPQKPDTPTATPGSATKKRKRPSVANDSEDDPRRHAPKPPLIRKLTLKQSSQPTQASKTAQAQTLKFKSKGKAPKRALGVGYDSELDIREADPFIHEGFVLRMQPGPDCDYLRKAIDDGTAGLARAKGGADIRMRMLDTLGRRGIIIIKGNQYATSLVDLPCLVEGMKSWDKRGWIKSLDISQMLLVLGRCYTDEEARNYALPEDVDPKNYQYAHGLTAPMKWVRKRRFARTKRARVDDIEAVERRVNALLEADKAAISSRYQLLDHDPRLDEERYSSGLDEDEDAIGEDDDEVDGYFSLQTGQHGSVVETPMFTETPVEDIGQDEVDEFERMFAGDDEGAEADTASQVRNTLHIPEAGDSSFAVTSTSASPSITVAHTPVSAAEQTSDDDDDDGEDDEDLDDAEKEGDENLQQVKGRIEDLQEKIAEQTDLLRQTQNAILKKKLARKIQDLKDDVAMMKKNAGLGGDEDDD